MSLPAGPAAPALGSPADDLSGAGWSAEATAVLSLRELQYARPTVGNEVSAFAIQVDRLHLVPGEALAVTGPSGCGKSTLIDLLALMRVPTAVTHFELVGNDVAALCSRRDVAACTQLRARHVGVVLQTGGLVACLSAFDNIAMGQRLLGVADLAWIDHLLDVLELGTLRRRLPAQLSVGQRQRVAIARALAHRPALVLADEPTASLNLEHADRVLQLLLSLARSGGSALLVASHDIVALQRHGISRRAIVSAPGGVALDAVECSV